MEFFVENISLVLFLPAIMCFLVGINGLLSNRLDNTSLFLVSSASSFINVLFTTAQLDYVKRACILNNIPDSFNLGAI